jgi:hypothetical protein
MNCDQVFGILTRGPFPTGQPLDEQVEAHLEVCADCWRLAEALRPALDVFQEAVPAAESRHLPGYWGDARPAAHVVAELAAQGLRTAVAPPRRHAAASRFQPKLEYTANPSWPAMVKVASFVAAATLVAVAVVLIMQG